MVDGGFREKIYGAEYFSKQDFDSEQFEIIWVEYYDRVHRSLAGHPNIKVFCLNSDGDYHPSVCFNKGIAKAQGELLIIPDADVIVKSNFLNRVWEIHQCYEKLVVYGYRYDEPRKGSISSLRFDELDKKCVLKNPINYGACLTIRKKWLETVNGYEQHPVFRSGFHANGLDLYTRFKNLGLAIQWEPQLKLYHPWHENTTVLSPDYDRQHAFVRWRQKAGSWMAVRGMDPELYQEADGVERFIQNESRMGSGMRSVFRRLTNRYFI